jgi:FKBP-type peptidyl-prolyl cis-trans isomerase FkpA
MRFSLLLSALLCVAATSAFAAAAAPQLLPSGVSVLHTAPGAGAHPNATDTVVVHYRGTLQSGVEFDSSYKRGQPATFPLNQVIPCWTQGVQTMQVGGKAKLVCPSSTAYGAVGIPGTIPPNTTLYFDVELVSIVKR